MSLYKNYLMHHGIEGQKWGVRHGPPYPLGQRVSGAIKSSERKEQRAKKIIEKRTAQRDRHEKTTTKDTLSTAFTMVSAFSGNPFAMAALAKSAVGNTVGSIKISSYLKKRGEQNLELDKKSGLYKKNKEFTREEDCKIINPEKSSTSSGAHNNCVLCSVSYDLRRRGYECIANYATSGYFNNEIDKVFKNSKRETTNRIHTVVNPKNGKSRSVADKTGDWVNKIKDKMSKMPNGSIGLISVDWCVDVLAPMSKQGAHCMAYEVIDNNFTIFDCQTGKKITSTGSKFYTNSGKQRSIENLIANTNEVRFIRTDNLQPDFKYIREMGMVI